jgi:hypothetical protein
MLFYRLPLAKSPHYRYIQDKKQKRGGRKMLVVNGFFENGVFVPAEPITAIQGRQAATLTIKEAGEEQKKQERIQAWREFSRAIRTSTEQLEGEPEKLRFRNPEEIEAL